MTFTLIDIENKLKKFFKRNEINKVRKKIKLADNKPLSNDEYDLVCKICDVFISLRQSVNTEMIAPPKGGVFWENASPGMGPFELYLRKNRQEINHLYLLFNAFRDFCALAYEFDQHTPKPDYWIRRYLRLSSAVEKKWRVTLPSRFGELGWNINGFPVNRWTSVNQERISALTLAGITHYLEQQQSAKILEIGGGSGEMGYVFLNALPNSTWFNADLLGCLIYSAIQLSINLPNKKHYVYVGNTKLTGEFDENLIIRCPEKAAACKDAVIYIPHFLLDDFADHLKLHLAYNTYSFGEMPKSAVSHYSTLLSKFLKDEGILFEQNGYFPERGGENAEETLSNLFTQQVWPSQLDGRWFPNGPVRVWTNNNLGKKIQGLIQPSQTDAIINSLQDNGDAVDIQYPNEILWPKVYELFSSPQEVKQLYPW